MPQDEAMPSAPPHVPVMVEAVMEFLCPEEGGPYWDLTLGAGGHLAAFLHRAPPNTDAFGLDGDPVAIETASHLPATLLQGDLGDLATEASAAKWPAPRAILIDAGLSSMQVDDSERGFSYRQDGPLDMRMDTTRGPTAAEWLNSVTRDELERVLRELGEERFAGRIARVIKESLPIQTTEDLTRAILRALGRHRGGRHHPARRTFQGIRIAVNRELERLEAGIRDAIDALVPGGRLVVLSYHSGEDRLAKNLFRQGRQDKTLTVLTKKPLRCDESEAAANPRARSVRLRAAEKTIHS
jgi:16S rRNA (cytosine1402-N4)-methyltransferase